MSVQFEVGEIVVIRATQQQARVLVVNPSQDAISAATPDVDTRKLDRLMANEGGGMLIVKPLSMKEPLPTVVLTYNDVYKRK